MGQGDFGGSSLEGAESAGGNTIPPPASPLPVAWNADMMAGTPGTVLHHVEPLQIEVRN